MLETFWRYLLYACLAWYASVTLFVAVRGAIDIRTMLRSLSLPEHRKPDDEIERIG
jgi:hypothetical protein